MMKHTLHAALRTEKLHVHENEAICIIEFSAHSLEYNTKVMQIIHKSQKHEMDSYN